MSRRLLLLCLLLVAVLFAIRSLYQRARRTSPGAAMRVQVVEAASATGAAAAPAAASGAPLSASVRQRDRAARDRVRERIYRALGRTPPAPPSAARDQSASLPRDAGTLDAAYIQRRIREDFVPLAGQCYEAALERAPRLGGKLVFSFVIVGDDGVGGIVESAEVDPSSTLTDPELVYCLRESLLSVSFEPPPESGVVSVVYPFTFSPDGPDGG